MEQNHFDYIVVGAGINGSWSAYHLSKRGYKVLLLEQFPLPHTRGSSHGQTRGIRKAYYEYFYAEMMPDAYEQWQLLEKESNTELLRTTGLLNFGPKNETAIGQMVDALEKLPGSKFEYYTSNDLSRKYPESLSKSSTKDLVGCIDYDAGLLLADKALLALWNVAKSKYRCTIVDSSPVQQIIPAANGQSAERIDTGKLCMVVCRNGKTYQCRKLILCAGPWTNKLTENLSWKLPLEPVKITVCYFKANMHHFPHNFIFASDDESQDIWGLSEYEYPGMVKICLHNGPVIDPDKRDNKPEDVEDINARERFISTYLPCVDTKPSIQESCIYTVTPDRVHIVDIHPLYKDIIVGCGFSGTGFKLGPVTGEMMADMAVGAKTKYDRTPFLASRFKDEKFTLNDSKENKVLSKI